MTPSEIRIQIRFIPYYRLYIELANKVFKLQKKRAQANTHDKKKIYKEIRDLQANYRPRLIKARSLKDE